MDVFLVDATGTELISGIAESDTGPEMGQVTVTGGAQTLYVVVACWTGSPGPYEVTVEVL